MKEKETVPEKTIVIDIKLTRGLVVALSCVLTVVALLVYLTLTGKSAVASETETAQAASTGMRQFYLTNEPYLPNEALTACEAGYHMASIWEIADPSNLKYNTSLGYYIATTDSGQGPPSCYVQGWIRTGYASATSNTPGHANCAAWTSVEEAHYGTTAELTSDWISGDEDMGVWDVYTTKCISIRYVWCIED